MTAFDNAADLSSIEAEIRRMGPVLNFPWHKQQEAALRAATDIVAVIGGNRSGKSMTGQGAVARLARRDGPIYQRLRGPEGRRIKMWLAPQTFEKYKQVWEGYARQALDGLTFDYVQTPHPVFTVEDGRGGIEIWGKAQEQGFLSFESDQVDFILFDEEPDDPRVFSSAKTRMATTNGVIMLTFTPLLGLSWTYSAIYVPCVKDQYEIGDRVWRRGNEITVVNMGMADNPEAVAGGGVQRLAVDPSISQAEKDARLYGTYGFTEGLLIQAYATLRTEDDSPYIIDELPADRAYYWLLTADPNKRHGALLTAWDDLGNRYYCAEHYAEGLPDTRHAEGYRRMLAAFDLDVADVDVFADPGGAGAQAIINLAETGFNAQPVPKDPGSVSASIKRLRRAAFIDPTRTHPVRGTRGAPSAYFLRSLRSVWDEGGVQYNESRLLWELRQYRQKPASPGQSVAPDTPIKINDDVVDCARYAELVHMAEPKTPKEDLIRKARKQLDSASKHEAEAFDKMSEHFERLYARLQRPV